MATQTKRKLSLADVRAQVTAIHTDLANAKALIETAGTKTAELRENFVNLPTGVDGMERFGYLVGVSLTGLAEDLGVGDDDVHWSSFDLDLTVEGAQDLLDLLDLAATPRAEVPA